ncbi:MAG: VWA domain-containing protein [Acidobacteria bacterium]|nr:VWA domain-containing protein [Acidobacteriota bacterium]
MKLLHPIHVFPVTLLIWLLVQLPVPTVVRGGFNRVQEKRGAEQGESIELRSDLVSIPVAVAFAESRRAPVLTKNDFVVLEDGKPQEISHFSAQDAAVDIVLALDTSGSMKSDIDKIREAAREFVERMRSQDPGAIVSFARSVDLLSDLTRERFKLKEALREISPGSGTAYYDALYLVAEDILKSSRSPRKAVLALTDGVDSASYYTFAQMSDLVERSGAAVYFIEIDTEEYTVEGLRKERFMLSPEQLERYRRAYRPDENPIRYRNPRFFMPDETAEIAKGLYRIARKELRQVATRTGGTVFPLKTLKDLPKIYAQLASELGTLYSLGYYPTNSRRDGSWRKLTVTVKAPGGAARSREGYWAPAK